MRRSPLGWVTLTHAYEIPYNRRSLVLGFYLGSVVLIALSIVLSVILVGYDTKFAFYKDPNITRYDYWWTPKHLPDAFRIRANAGDCELGKLNQDVTLRTNSSLPIFPYQFKSSYTIEQSKKGSGATIVTRFVDGLYQANPLSSCFVSEMGLYYEAWWQNSRVIATITCEPTESLPRFFKFTTFYSASGAPYMRPDSTLNYLIYDVHPDKTAFNFEEWLIRDLDLKAGSGSSLNVLGVLDTLSSDIAQIGWLQSSPLNTTERANMPATAFFGWNLMRDEHGFDNSGKLELLTPSPWYSEFSYYANRTILNFMIAIHDAIHLDLGHTTSNNIFLNKTAFSAYIQPNPLYLSVLRTYQKRPEALEPNELIACSWTQGCLPNPNITWVEVLREDVRKLPHNTLILPTAQSGPTPISVIDMAYLCPVYVRKSWGNMLVSVFSATFSVYGTLYTLFSFIAPKLDSPPRSQIEE